MLNLAHRMEWIYLISLINLSSFLSKIIYSLKSNNNLKYYHQHTMQNKQFSVRNFYQNKSILITGTTGFLGKVIMEKFLYSCPNIKKIYVLIRLKKGSTLQERFKKELVSSPCFDRLRNIYNENFEKFISEKITPIHGDLLQDNLGLNPESEELLIENVNIIINSAASVEFNSELDYALQINVLGPLKILNLASKIKNLDNFLQISTAYVNSYRFGYIEEKQLNTIENPEAFLKELLAIDPTILRKDTKKIIKKFPNTYTFTKNLAEQILASKKKNIPLTIVRPSIVSCSMKEPLPGWIDTFSASGAIYLLAGLGVLQGIHGDIDNIGDQIPLDYVVNQIIVAGAYYANKTQINVFHSATSHLRPFLWKISHESIFMYFKLHPPDRAYDICNFNLVKNENLLKLQTLTRRVLPVLLLHTGKILKNNELKKKATKGLKVLARAESIGRVFSYFTANEWIFESNEILKISTVLTAEEKEIFNIDVKNLDWINYMIRFGWGIRKYVLKEDVKPLEDELHSININEKISSSIFSDIQWAYKNGKVKAVSSNKDIRTVVLNSTKVKHAIAELTQKLGEKCKTPEEKLQVRTQIFKKANNILKLMSSSMNPVLVRTGAWILRKYFRRIYEKVIVNDDVLKKVKNFTYNTHGPIILLPTHRSYIDFLIVTYIAFSFGLQIPNVAVNDDFLGLFVMTSVLRACGGFFMFNESPQYQNLYSAIFSEYVTKLLHEGSTIEFFIERNRSRTNKILEPDFTLLEVVTECILDGKIPDAQIIPCTINYEKVLEGETFPLELLGEEKVRESIWRVLFSLPSILKSCGRVYIEFSEPRSYKTLVYKIAKNLSIREIELHESKSQITKEIATNIVIELESKVVVMPTTMIAGIILMNRKGIDEDDLTKRVDWLSKELNSRGIKIAGIAKNSNGGATVRNSLNLLSEFLKHKKDILEPHLIPDPDYKNTLMLSYYRYPLVSIFFKDAIIATTMLSFGNLLAYKEGVHLNRLHDESNFLFVLFDQEKTTNLKNSKDEKLSYSEFEKILNVFIDKKIFVFDEISKNLTIRPHDEANFAVQFFGSLLWPFVEAYWVTIAVILSLKIKENISHYKLIRQIQWFAETMFEEKVMGHYESCSFETIKNSLNHFHETGLISITSEYNSKIGKSENTIKIIADESEFLKQIDHIQKFLKTTPTRSYKTPLEVKKSIMNEIILESKL